MKKRLTKILVVLSCLALLLTSFSIGAFAAEERVGLNKTPAGLETYPTITGYEWYPLGAATATQETGKYFIISTTAGSYAEKLYISFPAEGGFRLQAQHETYQDEIPESVKGLLEPSSIATIEYKHDASGAVIMTGKDGTVLRYTESEDGFRLQVMNKNQKTIVSIYNDQISFAYKVRTGKVVRTMVEMPITADGKEVIYQGGERYNDTNQIGWYTSLTNADCWSDDQFGYINVPLFHSNRGYSMWFNMPHSGEADMGANDPLKWQLRFDSEKLDFFLWAGTPLENLKKYTSITGTSGMYNEWTFGFWSGAMSQAFDEPKYLSDKSQSDNPAYYNMVELIQGYMDNYGFYPESFYGEGKNSQYSTNIAYQKDRGMRTTYWYHPAVSKAEYETYMPGYAQKPKQDDNGAYVGPDGRKYASTGYPWVYVTQPLFAKGVFQFLNITEHNWIDFSNPSSKEVFNGEFNIDKPLWEWGVKGAMIDYGEYVSFGGTSWNGLSTFESHNFNSYYYAMYAAESFQEYHNGDYVLFQRSGCAGTQYFVGNFLGDQKTDWEGYKDQIYSMISLGSSGYNLYGGDLCGLSDKATNDLMSRWMTLITFSPWMRQHGKNIHKPWQQGEANANNFGDWYYFRKNIVPTVMSAAMDANKTSNPIIKGMMVAYPYQLSLSKVNNQYLFCDDFLVCAVTEENQYTLDVHLPNGSTWYNLFTYERLEGNQILTVEAPTAFSPVFVKAGAVKAINLPESMILADEMHDEDSVNEEGMDVLEQEFPHASLLVTPPDETRSTTIHVLDGDVKDFRTYDSHIEEYTNKVVNNSTFAITADNTKEGSQRTTVLALGTTAKSVKVDGTELTRYNNIPSYYDKEYGYHVEASGLTTIYVPEGWKEIVIEKGDAKYESLPLNGQNNAMDRLFDDDVTTYYQMPYAAGSSVDIDIKTDEPTPVKRMIVKWAIGYLSSYDVEYTEDGENWNYVEHKDGGDSTVVKGGGSFDVIEFEPGTKAIAVRITAVQKSEDVLTNPMAYEIGIYAPTEFDDMSAYDEMADYEDDDEWDDDWDDEAANKGKRKKIIRRVFPWWALALIIGGAVLLATGILLLILLLLKKKKKKEAEEALNAAEEVPANVESPTDFPNPVE